MKDKKSVCINTKIESKTLTEKQKLLLELAQQRGIYLNGSFNSKNRTLRVKNGRNIIAIERKASAIRYKSVSKKGKK